jgi:phosphate-selective porin
MFASLTAAGAALLAAAAASTPAQPASATPPAHPTITIGGYVQGELDAGAQGDTRFPAPDRFFLRRVRLMASGTVLPTVAYHVQVDFAGGLGSASVVAASLTDGYVEWTRFAAAHVQVGQFKAPFGREWLVPSTQLATVERTLATDRLTLNRQIGIMVDGNLQGDNVGYQFGMFNGNGRNTTVNDNKRFMYVARGSVTPWRAASARLQVGANAYWSDDTKLSMPVDFGFDSTPQTTVADNVFTGNRRGAGIDAHFQARAWSADAELLRIHFDQTGSNPARPGTSTGWYVLPARYVYQRVIQIVGRYERYRPDTAIADNTTSEWTAGVNYYVGGTSAKLMADYLWVDTPAATGHQKLLAQLQVIF